MQKIVTNRCYGGFGLSEKAVRRYAELKGIKLFLHKKSDSFIRHWTTEEVESSDIPDDVYWSEYSIERDDPILVQVVEELGEEANGRCANLFVTEVPDGVEWQIEEYDGTEWIAEKHRTW